jgi:hypothetical protein
MSFDYDSYCRERDLHRQEELALRGLVTIATRVTIPSSKNRTLVWLMSDGTFTARVLKTDYDGPPDPIPGAGPFFDPPAHEIYYCYSITVLNYCKCPPKEGEDPLSLIYLGDVPLVAKKQ